MRKKLALMLAVGLVAGAFGSVAGAQKGESVRGGGQIVVSTNQGSAGDTIGFTVDRFNDSLRGQVQYVPTSTQDGETVSTGWWHSSNITCLEVFGNVGVFAGEKTLTRPGTNDDNNFFQVSVNDIGDGNEDQILLEEDDEEFDCNEPEDFDDFSMLRGNARVSSGS